MDLRDHLVLCGTKTDQCPECYKYIQRSYFAYHYENNCADINELEASRDMSRPYPVQPISSRNDPDYRFNRGARIPCQFCGEACSGEQLDSHQVNIDG